MRKLFAIAALTVCAAAHAAGWEYSESTDKMSGKKSVKAVVVSDNSLNLGFPYAGENRASLLVRNHAQHGIGVVLHIAKGQLLCSDYSGCSINVRFDDRPQMKFSGAPSADHDSTTMFFNNEKRFIAEAIKAKKILIQPSVYQNGEPILEFTVPQPLEWPRPVVQPPKKP